MTYIQNKFPVGVSDFRELLTYRSQQTNARLMIDKSLFIRDLLSSGAVAYLFTRPPQFGKTLILSMIEHFFSPEVNGKPTAGMFDDLKIAAYPQHMKHQGQTPVISFNFKDARKGNLEDTLYALQSEIHRVYLKHQYLLESPKVSEYRKPFIQKVLDRTAISVEWQRAVESLSSFLRDHYGKDVIILIDEFDTPIYDGYVHGYDEKIVYFMSGVLSPALKGNRALEFGVMTGLSNAVRGDVFSGLNNLAIYSVLCRMYSEYFGFTEDEVSYLIDQSGIKNLDRQKIKETYNGYKIGEEALYNTSSIINCLNNNGELGCYLANTPEKALVENVIVGSNSEFALSLISLLQGESMGMIGQEGISLSDLKKNLTAVSNFLLMTGYLAVDSQERTDTLQLIVKARIPNREIMELYEDILNGWMKAKGETKGETKGEDNIYNNFLKCLIAGKIEECIKIFPQITEKISSCFDISLEHQKNFYHGLILSIVLGIKNTHEVRSSRERYYGNYDLMIIPKDVKQYPLGIVMEFKFVKEEAQIEAAAAESLTQTQARNYEQELADRGINRVLMIGIGFAGKEAAVSYSLRG